MIPQRCRLPSRPFLALTIAMILPQPALAIEAAGTPLPAAANSQEICQQLGLSPESSQAKENPATTETVAKTASDAKASGVRIATAGNQAGGGKASTKTASKNAANPNEGGQPAISAASRCTIGLRQMRKANDSVVRARAAQDTLKRSAASQGVDWRMLAAIGIRESGFRDVDEIGSGKGWGVFQLTNQKGVSYKQAHDLAFASNFAAKMLASDRRLLARKFPKFTPAQLDQATAAAYNFGPDDISGNPTTIDNGTTWNNYGQSVLNVMQCF